MDIHFQKFTEILIAKHVYLLSAFLIITQRQELFWCIIGISFVILKIVL